MRAEVHQLRPRAVATNWMCSSCGVDAGCNCGAPLMSKQQRAAEAIASNPRMSDRAIADEIGVSRETVRKERNSTDNQLSVEGELRIGLDGKERRMPVRQIADDDDGEDIERITPSQKRNGFLIRANEAMLLAAYDGPVNQAVIEAAKATAAAWCRVVETMEQGK